MSDGKLVQSLMPGESLPLANHPYHRLARARVTSSGHARCSKADVLSVAHDSRCARHYLVGAFVVMVMVMVWGKAGGAHLN